MTTTPLPAPNSEVWLTVPEAAAALRLTTTAARQQIYRGSIPVMHFGRSVRVPLRFVNHPTAETAKAIRFKWEAELATLSQKEA